MPVCHQSSSGAWTGHAITHTNRISPPNDVEAVSGIRQLVALQTDLLFIARNCASVVLTAAAD